MHLFDDERSEEEKGARARAFLSCRGLLSPELRGHMALG